MSRKKNFEQGHTPLSEYQSFAEQRPAFATAREIVARSIPADLGMIERDGRIFRDPSGKDTPEKVMDRKYESAQKRGIAEDVLKRGIVHPVRMVPDGAYPPAKVGGILDKVPLLWNGQHRVAVMYKHRPDEPIPLDWDSFDGFDARKNNTKYNKPIPDDPKPKKTAAKSVKKRAVRREP